MKWIKPAFYLALFFGFHAAAFAESPVKPGEKLDVARCVEIALGAHPDIAASTGAAEAGKAKAQGAKSGYYPQIGLSAGYSQTDYSTTVSSTGRYQLSRNYSAGASATQTIFDFGKTSSQADVQRYGADSAMADLENVRQQIVFNVRQAYYGLAQAIRNVELMRENVRQYEDHMRQARGFFDAGAKPKYEVTKAAVDLSSARLNLMKAGNALKIARLNLDNAMGITGAPEYSIVDGLAFTPIAITLEQALEKAAGSRPDLMAAAAMKNSAEQSLRYAESGHYPTLSGSASYDYYGEKPPLDSQWSAGVTFTLPLFSGFSTRYQVEEARANLTTLTAKESALIRNIQLEVQKAYVNLKDAEERIAVARESVQLAVENQDLANGRYAAGVGNSIEVSDAQAGYVNAKTAHNQALADYKVAEASLYKAIGER
ncbi:MAG: TolC family protein [Nitrospinae bacterium]|nr:TolC family protein [Nitrospinota bacterium]